VPQQEQEASINIGQYVQMLLHRKWWLIISVFVVWAVMTVAGWTMPSEYDSDALILIQRQQLDPSVVKPNVQIDLQQRLDTMTQQVLSRSNLSKIIEKYNLYPKQRRKGANDELVDAMRKDIKIELVAPGQANRKGVPDLTGFTVSFTGPSATIAQQVTQDLVGLFITENINTTTEINKQATDFLQTQLDQASKDLADQEARLRQFKDRHLGELPEQLQANLQILTGLQGRLQQASDALSHAQQQELYLQSLLTQYGTMSDSGNVPGSGTTAIEQRLTTMRAELAAMREKYTDKHPDVIHLEHDIAATEALKKQMSQEQAAGSGTTDTQGLASLAQVKSQLKANELEIANRKKDVKDIEGQIASYQSRLNQTPVSEQELANIQRDHEQSLANYNSLLSKKQAADLASNLVNRQQGDQLQLVDPASLPDKASSPNRLKFSLAGIGVGLALGLGLIVGRELMSPMVYNEDQAATIVRAPILSAIPSVLTASEQAQTRRAAVIQWGLAGLILSIIPIGTALTFLRG